MTTKLLITAGLAGLTAVGCARLNPQAKIAEAGRLVAERVGRSPEWLVPWDASPPAWAAGEVLPLDEAVRLALRNNRQLRAEMERIGQAGADLAQAGLLPNPVLSFMLMFPDGGGRAMLRGGVSPLASLADLWLIPARQNVAQAELQQAVLRLADLAVATVADVKAVYVRLQYTRRALELTEANARLAEQTARVVEARQIAGQSTQVALNLARLRGQRLRSELLALQAEYGEQQRELLLLVGLAGAPDHWTVTPLHEMEEELPPPESEAALVAHGCEQRLDAKAAEWSVQLAERQVALVRREGLPEMALGFTFERAAAPRAPRGPTIPARVGNAASQALVDRALGVAPMVQAPMAQPWQPRMRDVTWTLGPALELEVPLFDQNQARIARAAHEYNQRVAEYEARRQEVMRDVRTARLRQQAAAEQVRFYRAAIVPAVERNLVLAEQAYVAGQEDLTVYLQAQEDLIMTSRTMLEFVRDYHLRGVELERAVGGRLPAPGAAAVSDSPARDNVSEPAPPQFSPASDAPAEETRHEHAP